MTNRAVGISQNYPLERGIGRNARLEWEHRQMSCFPEFACSLSGPTSCRIDFVAC